MAGCCPPAPPSQALGAVSFEANGEESPINPGENVDCYARRAGSMSGLQDDATDTPINKIANTTIPIDPDASVDVQFEMTPESAEADSWEMEYNGNTVSSIDGVAFDDDGYFHGTFNTLKGKAVKVKVLAYDEDGELMDARTYTFSPTEADDNSSITFISPLPGSIVTSKYGPRLHPITKVMKAHTGIDMAIPGGAVVDVVAAADGEVILSGGDPGTGYGLRVHVRHVTSSGKPLCTTTYNHLEKFYVSVGQKVMAGQSLGHEGKTGASTGNHLHFECKLPNGQFVDPEPYINGPLKVASQTQPDGQPVESSIKERTSKAQLSGSEVEIRAVNSCESFGGTYPDDESGDMYQNPNQPPKPPETPPVDPDDIFEIAFNASMKYEVGPAWSQSTPAVISGSIITETDRKANGYVNDPVDSGGLTKYGVSQNANRTTDVKSLNLADAKNIYFNKYWKAGNADTLPNPLAVMHFDTCVNHGVARAKSILSSAGGSSASVDAYAAARQKVYDDIVKQNPSQARFTRGWSARVKGITDVANSV